VVINPTESEDANVANEPNPSTLSGGQAPPGPWARIRGEMARLHDMQPRLTATWAWGDRCTIGKYEVAASWIAEDFPELATHADDPFVRYLDGETAFEPTRKERVVRRVARLYPYAVALSIPAVVLVIGYANNTGTIQPLWVLGAFIFLWVGDYVFWQWLLRWSDSEMGRLRRTPLHKRILGKLSPLDEVALPMTAREFLIAKYRNELATSRASFIFVLLINMLIAALAIKLVGVRGIPPSLIGSLVGFSLIASTFFFASPLAGLILRLDNEYDTWLLFSRKTGLLELGQLLKLTGRKMGWVQWIAAIGGLAPMLVYLFFASKLLVWGMTSHMDVVGPFPLVLVPLIPLFAPAFVRAPMHGAARYVVTHLFNDALHMQENKYGENHEFIFPEPR